MDTYVSSLFAPTSLQRRRLKARNGVRTKGSLERAWLSKQTKARLQESHHVNGASPGHSHIYRLRRHRHDLRQLACPMNLRFREDSTAPRPQPRALHTGIRLGSSAACLGEMTALFLVQGLLVEFPQSPHRRVPGLIRRRLDEPIRHARGNMAAEKSR